MRLMVISPHPDDETLGAGGSLLRLREEKNQLFWLNVTNMKEKYGYGKAAVEKRQREIEVVAQEYGFEEYVDLELEPAGLDKMGKGELILLFKSVFDKYRPDTVIVPYKYDVHSDHGCVFDSVYSCIKPFRAEYIRKILCMEIISETDQAMNAHGFVPNFFMNVESYIERKIEIVKNYSSEIKDAPFPRNPDAIKGLAAFRGATAGCKYAEAFMMVREIV